MKALDVMVCLLESRSWTDRLWKVREHHHARPLCILIFSFLGAGAGKSGLDWSADGGAEVNLEHVTGTLRQPGLVRARHSAHAQAAADSNWLQILLPACLLCWFLLAAECSRCEP